MLVDYMTINMLHQLIINSINEVNDLFRTHTKYLPSQDLLEKTALDATLEGPREPEDPAVKLY